MAQPTFDTLDHFPLESARDPRLGPVIGESQPIAHHLGLEQFLRLPPQHVLQSLIHEHTASLRVQPEDQPWCVLNQTAVFGFGIFRRFMQAGIADRHRQLFGDGGDEGQRIRRTAMRVLAIELQGPEGRALGDQRS